MDTGGAIKAARTAANLTQAELAKKMGVTPQTISQYERGLINPKFETLEKFANALDVRIETLLEDSVKSSIVASIESGFLDAKNFTPDMLKSAQQAADSVSRLVAINHAAEDIELEELETDFLKLNSLGRKTALERIHELTEISRYLEDVAENEKPTKE